MKVAVFGSWSDLKTDHEWQFLESKDAFTSACKEIGREVAERGHTLIIESDKPTVADPYVVAGYVERAVASAAGELKVELAWPRGLKRPFEKHAISHPRLFKYHQLPVAKAEQQRWSNSHLISLKHADAVLTIGGKQGTYLAGSAAIVANKPIVPIASFGGASARLLSDLKTHLAGDLSSAYNDLNAPWSFVVLKKAVGLLDGGIPATTIFISHAHADVVLAEAIVEMLMTAFAVASKAICCTSVPGHKLPAGAHTASHLRREIQKAEFMLGIVTPQSVQSKYVLFELGAAWGLGRRTFPLVARGIKRSDIPGPLRELHAIDLAIDTDCLQLIQELRSSKHMYYKDDSIESVQQKVKQLVKRAKQQKKVP